jgi:hypothetical protein
MLCDTVKHELLVITNARQSAAIAAEGYAPHLVCVLTKRLHQASTTQLP